MQLNDIVIILVMTFPMFIFTIYLGIWLSEYVDKKYSISESQKRAILVSVTFIGAFLLSSLLYLV